MAKKKENQIPSAEEKKSFAESVREAENASEGKLKKGTPKKIFQDPRFKRGSFAVMLSVGFIAVVVLINVLFSILEERYPSMQIDMTTNQIYSLSEDALEAAEKVDIPTTIYILADEESAKSGDLTYQGNPYSQVTVLVERMRELNSNITVEYVDLDRNPTFASDSKYAGFSLGVGSVIVENERRVRVLGLNDLYAQSMDQYTGQTSYRIQVDSALTSALMQVTAEDVPVVSIAAGSHSERLASSLSSLQSVLQNNQFEIKTFDIMTEEIPEDTQIVLLPTPMTDYTAEEIQKLDAFLASDVEGYCSLWVTFYPSQTDMPNLSAFLAEWGIGVPAEVIVETDTSNLFQMNGTCFFSNPTDEVDLGGEANYQYLATEASKPLEILFDENNSVITYALTTTSDTCCVLDAETMKMPSEDEIELGSFNTTVLATRQDRVNDEYYYKSVIAFGSDNMLSDEYVAGTTFGNGTYLVDLARYATGTTDSSTGVYMEQVDAVTVDITASVLTRLVLGIGVFTILIPAAILVAGLVVFLKRRHL